MQKIKGYNAIKSFLHKVNKIVKKECAKYESGDMLSWYSKWKKWNKNELFESTSINKIGKIVCMELKYKERRVKSLAQKNIPDIAPVSLYIQVN